MFTVGFVNYKSSVYMETQLKIYSQYAGEKAKIIILDNSQSDEEFLRLDRIVSKFPNEMIKLVQHEPKGSHGSPQHGEGLQKIYEMVDTDFYLTQDPDFFWVFPDFLTFFREKLKENTAVGACHYTAKFFQPAPFFPVMWGSAYRMDRLKEIKADFNCCLEKSPLFSGGIKDVGGHVLEALRDDPHYYFTCRVHDLKLGKMTWRNQTQEYRDGEKIVAYHIQRGTFETLPGPRVGKTKDKVGEIPLPPANVFAPTEWTTNREKACKFFLNTMIVAASKKEKGTE